MVCKGADSKGREGMRRRDRMRVRCGGGGGVGVVTKRMYDILPTSGRTIGIANETAATANTGLQEKLTKLKN